MYIYIIIIFLGNGKYYVITYLKIDNILQYVDVFLLNFIH